MTKTPRPNLPISRELLGKILKAIKDPRVRVAFFIFRDTGMRISDLIKLRIQDFRFSERKVYVKVTKRTQVVRDIFPVMTEETIREIKYYIANTLKGKKRGWLFPSSYGKTKRKVHGEARNYHLKNKTVMEIPLALLMRRPESVDSVLEVGLEVIYRVFPVRVRGYVSKRTVQYWFENIQKELGVDRKISPHDFRTTLLTESGKKKIDAGVMALQTGQTEETINKVYKKFTDEDQKDAIDDIW